MNITVKIPLRTSERKRKKLQKTLEKQQEIFEEGQNKIRSIEKHKWGGRNTTLNHILKKEFPNKNGLHYSAYMYIIATQISDKYNNWMKDGFPGTSPDMSDINIVYLRKCNSEIVYDLGNKGVEIPLLENKDTDWYHMNIGGYQEKLLSKYDFASNPKIVKRDWGWELHQPVKIEEEDTNYEPETFIGVDFNFDRLAVAVAQDREGNVLETEFFDEGNKLQHYRNQINQIRKELQETKNQDKIEELGDKEERFVRQILHTISKRIVNMASSYNKPVIRVEDTGIQQMRDQVNEMNKNWFKTSINSWPVGQLKDFIEYKANKEGIKFEKVNPRDTSKLCNKCGEEGKRPYQGNQKRFYCQNCNYEIDADFNAARNLAKKPI